VTDHAASSGCGGGEDEAEEESESSPKLKRRSAKSKVIITHTDPPRKIFGQKRKERKVSERSERALMKTRQTQFF